MDIDRIESHLSDIQTIIHDLITLLPDEQKYRGSELQRIDFLVNDLYYRYVVEARDNLKED